MNVQPVTDEEVKAWAHPSEASRFALAGAAVALVTLLFIVLSIVSSGVFLVVLALFIVSLWVTGRMTDAKLRGGAVQINEVSFPHIAEEIEALAAAIHYRRPVTAFIVQDGEINAFFWRVFGRKYLALNSQLVEKLTDRERQFVIARFIGGLKAKHLRFGEAVSFIDGLEQAWVINVTILPYVRATVLSGDRIGVMLVGDGASAITTMTKLLIGADLSAQVSANDIVAQGQDLRFSYPLFRHLATLFSTHPHMTDRFIELASFIEEAQGPGYAATMPTSAAQSTAPPPPPTGSVPPNPQPSRPLPENNPESV